MKIAVIGLGKMGFNLARNISMKFDVAAFDIDAQRVNDLKKYNIYATTDLSALIEKLPEQKIVWLMVPAGNVIDSILAELKHLLKKGDIIIDGGNSFYKDSIRRGLDLADSGIGYLDCGTSGGQDAALTGVCTMVGGNSSDYEICKNLFEHISVDGGHVFTGESGSGHFVKMVHNGIEYGMMQSIAEGFELMDRSGFNLNLADVAETWNNGSVIRSWLIELTAKIFKNSHKLEEIAGVVGASGEGEWTVNTAMEMKVPVPAISAAINSRLFSQQSDHLSHKVLAALRNEFGGHSVEKK